MVRKLFEELAAGCSIIKAPEETPASASELIPAFVDAGTLADVINLTFGTPSETSQYVIAHSDVRKISFTGSIKTTAALGAGIEGGMVMINHMGLGLPETSFGSIKDFGMGSMGGSEGIGAYLQTKFVSQMWAAARNTYPWRAHKRM